MTSPMASVDWIPVAGFVGGSLLVLLCFSRIRKKRLLQNLPTSKTTGVYIGLVELKGKVECGQPLTSYLAQIPTVYYCFDVSEHWSRTVVETVMDSKGRPTIRTRTESGWTSVNSGSAQTPFDLRDDYGKVQILPEGARIEPVNVFSSECTPLDDLYYSKGPDTAIADSTYRRRFTEQAIPVDAEIYIMGQAREREDRVAPEIAADPEAPLFLISTRTEEQICKGLSLQIWLAGIFGAVLFIGSHALRDHLVGVLAVAIPFERYAVVLGVYLLIFLAGWIWIVYNILVNLRQRVWQAASLVDVQLKRRNDLIPRLVEVVRGLKDHEITLQSELAMLRSQAASTSPQTSTGYQNCSRTIRFLAEKYPALTAQEAFLKLQKEISATEDRIALARSFYNEIATAFNTHLEVLPDSLVAKMMRLSMEELFQTPDTEKATPVVQTNPV